MYKLVSTGLKTVPVSEFRKYHFKVPDIFNHSLPWKVNWAYNPEYKSEELYKIPTNQERPRIKKNSYTE
jgi:hypothetical protein